ncbi:Transcription initiation factor TFIID subunit 11 [Arabidopsis thaliana]|uniref:Histone-fold n=3 Tax=Arabidopsis TaxID=3701 RepID=A0A8T2EH40_ARASU|nr:Histone-fold [Arabidopsis thaliana x Arabidopsis arenosa]KAG7621173.1 Histone-fold [Arabidopsis suecica]OAO97942.1 TAF11 [Arabidopsis thaliana]CAA0395908.1 unnamed protein product [Arabidopsis thaliana]CAD5328514.1 unnamed protein product [Arabidopsis thaliana]
MKHSKDPFEAAIEEEQEESPPESPVGGGGGGGDGSEDGRIEIDQTQDEDERPVDVRRPMKKAKTSVVVTEAKNKDKDEDDEEEEENMDVELTKYPTSSDPAKMAKMQTILSQFTEDQMSRYESFRRSALQRPQMKKLLIGVTGSQKIGMPMIIVACGIAKMFVGELVETARVVMAERKESGPIRPCHIRESYRRLKLEGKVPKRSVPRLFR